MLRVRLLPTFVFVCAMALVLRLGDVWSGVAALSRAEAGNAESGEALDTPPAAGAEASESESDEAETHAEDEPAPPINPLEMTDEEIDVLQTLAERREALELRAQSIDRRAALLEAKEKKIEEKLAALKEVEKNLEKQEEKEDGQTDANLDSLVRIYESMKPKDAARIFEQLDMDVLIGVIGRMKERKSASILADMDPMTAKAVTLALAQQEESLNPVE